MSSIPNIFYFSNSLIKSEMYFFCTLFKSIYIYENISIIGFFIFKISVNKSFISFSESFWKYPIQCPQKYLFSISNSYKLYGFIDVIIKPVCMPFFDTSINLWWGSIIFISEISRRHEWCSLSVIIFQIFFMLLWIIVSNIDFLIPQHQCWRHCRQST